MTSLVVLFSNQIKLNISKSKAVRKILSNKLYSDFNYSFIGTLTKTDITNAANAAALRSQMILCMADASCKNTRILNTDF